jgi:hypothetical protein
MGVSRTFRVNLVLCLTPVLLLGLLRISAAPPPATITLPIEIVGENGSTRTVAFNLPAARAPQVRALSMQIHGISYPDMISVQLNSGPWLPLNNGTVAVAEPGKSYGGIGGALTTLKMTMPLTGGAAADGANTLRFRFNRSNGVVSGFRVIAFNLLGADSAPLLEPSTFTQDDPQNWAAPLTDAASLKAGQELWNHAPLTPGEFRSVPMIHAHCADCHARDGRDLKYFSYSNESIVARSRFHGLSELQGRQIASYIRSLSAPSPGRPWNPPYQPGPGLDTQPAANWAAGAGIGWVLENDSATLPYLFPATAAPTMPALLPRITRDAFRPDGNLNPREIPIAFQLPDWNHWLPQIHPLDAWGPSFAKSEFADWYAPAGASAYAPGKAPAGKPSLRALLASPDLDAAISSGRIVAWFDKWRDARRGFLKPYVEAKTVNWTPELGVKAYSTELWQLVKTWELTQEFGLETRGRDYYGSNGEARTWFNNIPAATAPTSVNIPSGPSGMGGSALTNEYFDASWYQLQILLNSGNHRHRDRTPVDWVYVIGRFLDLHRETHRPEPARLLVAVIKAAQSTDPNLGPENRSQGWNPRQTVDPSIMISEAWAPVMQALPADVRRAATESLLAAWLEKNLQYSLGRYFTPGLSEASYGAPTSIGDISGGKIWKNEPEFRAAGVSAEVLAQLQKWGNAYMDMARRFQYSDSPRRSSAK